MTWKIPALSDCAPDIEPVEFKVLVAPAEKERQVGSIIIPESSAAKDDFAHEKGRLVALSPLAFSYSNDWPNDGAKPRVGDVVHFGRYAGALVEGADGKEYRLLSDRDIGAILQRGA